MTTELTIMTTKPRLVFNPITNTTDGTKPKGGIWSSPFDAATTSSPWTTYCTTQGFWTDHLEHDNWYVLTPLPTAKVYTITTASFHEFDRADHPGTLDFAKMSTLYDGAYCPPEYAAAIGWDIESTVWFHFCFASRMPIVK